MHIYKSVKMESAPQRKKIIVTGCNKGVGYGIVEGLCQQKIIPTVIMACRSQERASKALATLLEKYPAAEGHLSLASLDVGDFKSCEAFAATMQKDFGTIDCLMNNAGISINPDKNNEKDARATAQVNYFGTAHLSKVMLPLISDNGKIICVTSRAGTLMWVGDLSKEL